MACVLAVMLGLGCESTNSSPPPKPKVVAAPPPAPAPVKPVTAAVVTTPSYPPSKIPSLVRLKRDYRGIRLTRWFPEASPPPPSGTNSTPTAPTVELKGVAIVPTAIPKAALVTVQPAVPVIDSASSQLSPAWTIMITGVGLAWLVAYARYRFSNSARMRRQVRELRLGIEGTRLGLRNQSEERQAAVKAAGSVYIEATRKRFLASVTLDDIRKLAPGARMQPLRERGVNSLLDCHGWTAGNFMALHGIGADSGHKLAAACAALTKSVNQQPIPHPKPPGENAAASTLFQRIFLQRRAHEILKEPRRELETVADRVISRCHDVEAATTFWRWLIGSEAKGPLHEAIAECKVIVAEPTTLGARDAANRALQEANTIRRLADSEMVMDADAHAEIYAEALQQLLGPDVVPRGQARPRPAPPPIEPVWVRPSTPPVIPTVGYRIEVSIGSESGRVTGIAPADCWVGFGETTVVHGLRIEGPLYVGRGLAAVRGGSVEPALIDPQLPLAAAPDCRVRMLDYWSNYSHATAQARASYLQWLASGKSDPEADVGYVFLYFYGLERRALADPSTGAEADAPRIVAEVERLRTIYAKNRSFDRYSSEFLNYVAATQAAAVANEPPPLVRYNLPFSLRLKLGQFATDREALPAVWAHAWHYCDPRTRLPASAERCPELAQRLFVMEYRAQFAEGLVLPASRTRLKMTYRPASASFAAALVHALDVPDVSIMTTAYNKIDALAAECFKQLDPYSRYIWRNREERQSLEARLLLPPSLWPEKVCTIMQRQVTVASADGTIEAISLNELLEAFGGAERPTRAQYLALTRGLGACGVGIEPDLRFTKEVPDQHDPVALFALDEESLGPVFASASLIVQLAGAVASADGEFSDREASKLRQEIAAMSGLTVDGRRRLEARVATYRIKAPTTTGLRSAIDPLDRDTRVKVTDILLGVISGEGVIQPAEVKLMEKIYALLGLDTATLYPRLHGLAAAPETGSAPPVKGGPMRLDREKIARLKVTSDEVTKKLAEIFREEPAPVEAPKEEVTIEQTSTNPLGLPLDSTHGELLTLIFTRAQWTREEFEEICADKGLMPDGAIERINEAAFEKFDQPVIEGEDLLEISLHLDQSTTA